MITANLKETINEKWKNCWPVSELRPLGIIDLISFLFFIKRAYESELLHPQLNNSGPDFIYSPEINNFSWPQLQNKEAREIHKFFTKKNGLIHLVNEYAKTAGFFSDYFKAPLLIEPTPKLLSIAIEIVNIIESSEQKTKENIFPFLLSKCDDGFVPDTISDLIIGIAKPVPGDVIFDASVGSGNLLLKAMLRAQRSDKAVTAYGCDPDGVYLRIAAMNMAIHGIDERVIQAFSSEEILDKKPSLILSAMRPSVAIGSSGNTSQAEANIMNDIIEGLAADGRAVVFVQKEYLQSDLPAHIMTRKKLTDQNFLEAVISIDSKNNSPFAGGSVLLFSKNRKNATNILFYKWGNHKNETGKEHDNLQHKEIREILKQWELHEHNNAPFAANSFCIDTNLIRANHYNLNFNHYKIVNQFPAKTLEPIKAVAHSKKRVVVTQQEDPGQFFKSSSPLRVKKKKKKMSHVVLIIIILLCASIGFYWFVWKNNKSDFFEKTFQPEINVSSPGKVAGSNPETRSVNPPPDIKKEETVQPVKTHKISK